MEWNGIECKREVNRSRPRARDDSLDLDWKCKYANVGDVESSKYYFVGRSIEMHV